MSIALIVIFVVAVIAQGVLLWKGRGGWRWFHITSQVLTLMLAIAILFPTAGVLSSRNAWNKVKEELDARLAKAEAEQKTDQVRRSSRPSRWRRDHGSAEPTTASFAGSGPPLA